MLTSAREDSSSWLSLRQVCSAVTGPAYVIAHLQEAAPHRDIAEYMERTAYRAIAPLRSAHIDGDIVLVAGVPQDYDAAAAAAVREAAD